MTQFVFIHGFLGAPRAWDRVVRHLGDGRRCHCACLGGHLDTVCSADSFDGEVDRLAAWVRDKAGEKSHLVGYSLGGRIALGLLVRHTELWRAATIIGAHPGLEDEAEREARVAADERRAEQLESEGLASFLAAWEALPLFASQRALPRELLDEQRSWRDRHDPRGLAWSLRTLGLGRMPSWRRALRQVEIPVTVAAGDADEKFATLADWMAEVLPRGRSRRIPNSGHNAVLERPDAIGALLQEDQAS